MARLSYRATVNTKQLDIALANFTERAQPGSILKIFGQVMRSSREQTFREQGSPAGSWAPLKKPRLGGLILIRSGRLKNSINEEIAGNQLRIGSNVRYAGIQQTGGEAGRKPPFKKRGGHRAHIPARPYLVFRPDDPGRMKEAGEAYLAAAFGGKQ